MKRLTTENYWVDYYSKSSEDKRVIEKTCGFFDPVWKRAIGAVQGQAKSIIEIGAFPGRFLSYVATKFNLQPTGLDFNPEIDKVERVMNIMNVSDYNYVVKDFFLYNSPTEYDIVLSNGFIEHFEDYNMVMDMHCQYLAPGGVLVIMVPNKRYLRFSYGLLLDYKNLRLHNLECMRKRVFKAFAKRNKLEIIDVSYFGGFPYKVHDYAKLNVFQKLIYGLTVKVFRVLNPFLSKYPGRWWSGSLIGIYRKPSVVS